MFWIQWRYCLTPRVGQGESLAGSTTLALADIDGNGTLDLYVVT
jgi:hypothetical protein